MRGLRRHRPAPLTIVIPRDGAPGTGPGGCVTHRRFRRHTPSPHRTTHRLERLTGENSLRTKVIPRFPTERSVELRLDASRRRHRSGGAGIPTTRRSYGSFRNCVRSTERERGGGRVRICGGRPALLHRKIGLLPLFQIRILTSPDLQAPAKRCHSGPARECLSM